MPYPHIDCQFLMYSDVKAAMSHQTRASALPDFAYVAKGRSDYWIAQSPAREQKRKTLILADWSASSPIYYKVSEVRALLKQLMIDGFEIYLWQTDHLLKMQENNLGLLHQFKIAKGMIAPSYQSIETVASASPYRLAKDRVQILDDYWINYLLGDNPVPGPRYLNYADIVGLSDIDRPLIFSFLNTAKPKIESLVEDTAFFPQRALPGFDQLVRVFPDLKINRSYLHLTLLSHDYDVDDFKGAEWDALERVRVSGLSFSVPMLIKFLTLGKQCKKIELHRCSFNEYPGFSLDGIAPLNLQELDILYSKISSEIIQSIVQASPYLKKITFDHCTDPRGVFHFKDGLMFARLEEMVLSGCRMTDRQLKVMLEASPNLRTIALVMSKGITADFDLKSGIIFEHLESIQVKMSDFLLINLKRILDRSPNLREMNISELDCNASGHDLMVSINLDHLQSLIISANEMTARFLKSILDASRNLRKIKLFSSDNTRFNFDLQDGLTFEYLDEIDLSLEEFSPELLVSILSRSPHLRKIALAKIHYLLDEFALMSGMIFEHLEELEVSFSELPSEGLNMILQRSPNLKKLSLKNCLFLDDLDTQFAEIAVRGVQISFVKVSYKGASLEPEHLDAVLGSVSNKDLMGLGFPIQAVGTQDWTVQRPLTQRRGDGVFVDANTVLEDNKTFRCKALFFPIEQAAVSSYRLNIFQRLEVNAEPCEINQAFKLLTVGDFDLISCDIPRVSHDLFSSLTPGDSSFYGKHTIQLTNDWQALPSLSPSEVMRAYHLSLDVDVEIQYSNRDNLYYIRGKEIPAKTLVIDFIIDIPRALPMPTDIAALVDEFKDYKSGALHLPAGIMLRGYEYLEAISTQKKGACRHRAVAFKRMMDAKGMPSRIVMNDCHAYVEVRVEGQWLRCDLGGYPALLQIDMSHHPERPAGAPVVFEQRLSYLSDADLLIAAQYAAALSPWDKKQVLTDGVDAFCQHCVDGTFRQRLILCDTEETVSDLHFALQHYCRATHRPVFYIDSPDDLVCQSSYIHLGADNRGELRAGPGGPLHAFLTNPDLLNRVLIINYAAFKADDLVRFNALLDDVRKADGVLVSEDTVIVGLINKDNPLTPGNDFYGRFGASAVETCPLSPVVFRECRPVAPLLVPTDEMIEGACLINLYQAIDWKERLIGSYVMTPSGFVYEEGALQKAIRTGLPIRIMNGPIDSKAYGRFWLEAFQLGAIVNEGLRLELPVEVQARLSGSSGYAWTRIKARFSISDELAKSAFVLNPMTIYGPRLVLQQINSDFLTNAGLDAVIYSVSS